LLQRRYSPALRQSLPLPSEPEQRDVDEHGQTLSELLERISSYLSFCTLHQAPPRHWGLVGWHSLFLPPAFPVSGQCGGGRSVADSQHRACRCPDLRWGGRKRSLAAYGASRLAEKERSCPTAPGTATGDPEEPSPGRTLKMSWSDQSWADRTESGRPLIVVD
jgi:hypothetical protein